MTTFMVTHKTETNERCRFEKASSKMEARVLTAKRTGWAVKDVKATAMNTGLWS